MELLGALVLGVCGRQNSELLFQKGEKEIDTLFFD